MKLSKIEIQAFRGIRDLIALDFSSALTVLYAPNGTGKTSVCDAVEWLCTGQIDRLGIGLSDGLKEVRCAFASDEIPSKVRAVAWIDCRQHILTRTEDGAWVTSEKGFQKQEERDLLELLAPGLVDDNVHGMSANAVRRGWLRGCRFLSGESLALLVDSNESSLESRQRVFADILGTRSLVDTSRKIVRYCQTLSGYVMQERSQESTLRWEMERLHALPGSHESGGVSSGVAEEVAAAVEDLRQLGKELGGLRVSDISNVTLSESIDAVGRVLAQTSARLGQLTGALDEVEMRWPERSQLARRAEDLSTTISSLNSGIVVLRAEADEAAAKRQAHEQRIKHLQTEMAEIASSVATIHHLIKRLTPLVESVAELRALANCSMSELYASISEYRLPVGEVEARRNLAQELGRTWHEWGRVPEELSYLDSRQRELEAAITKCGDIAQLQSQRDRLRGDVQRQRQEYEATTGAVNILIQAAGSALQHLGGESRCPVCSTEFTDASALANAIHATIASMPLAQKTLAQRLTACESQLTDIELRIQRGLTLKNEIGETQSRFADVSALKKSRDDSLMQLGLSWGPDLPRAIAGASARLSAARILQDIHAAVQPLKLDDSAWVKDYKTFTSNLIQRADELTTRLRQEMVQCSKSVDELEIATSKAAGDCNKCSSDMARAVAELAVIQSTVQALRGKWESLVGQGVPWDDDEFARVKARQGKWLNLERMAETHLATARRIREYEEVSKLVEDRRANLRILRDRLQQVSSKVTLAKGVHELLEKRIENHTTEQIEALRSVVAPLFARMQANRVFDTVRTGDSALDWLGMAQGSSFSPDRHFSQGQRQDLALSIFLARARGLGGSFLLDEPLAHLDDLNRVALLDAMRVIVVEEDSDVNLVITTANRTLVKHLLQKFARVPVKRDTRPLRVYEMAGNPRVGVTVTELD